MASWVCEKDKYMKTAFVQEASRCGFSISFDVDGSEVDCDVAYLHLCKDMVQLCISCSKSPIKIFEMDKVPSRWLLRPVLRHELKKIWCIPYTGRNRILRFLYNVLEKWLQRIFPQKIEIVNAEGIFLSINRVDDVFLSIQQDGVSGWPAVNHDCAPEWFLRLASPEWWLEPVFSSADNGERVESPFYEDDSRLFAGSPRPRPDWEGEMGVC